MLSTTIVHVCARCGSERIRKNGHASNGAQRAKCLDCERTFILEPMGPRYDQPFKDQVLSAYQDRMSTRGIKRTFGVCYKTLMRWLGERMAALPAFVDALLPSAESDLLELDELWSFVGGKTQTLWRWVALCRRTRQIVAWTFALWSDDPPSEPFLMTLRDAFDAADAHVVPFYNPLLEQGSASTVYIAHTRSRLLGVSSPTTN